MKKYAQNLTLLLILSGLFIVSSPKLSAQIIVHVPLDGILDRVDRSGSRFYRGVPVYRPGSRFDYLVWKYRNRHDYQRGYYEGREDAYYDQRDRYEERQDYYEDRRDSRYDRRDRYDDRRDDYDRDDYDRRDRYNDRNEREERTYYDTRPRYDYYEENQNETLFKEYSAEGQFIRKIPKDAEKFKMGSKPFYMYEGVFYKPQKKGYVIIPPPIGMRVKYVPRGARHLQIDGLDYYEMNGTYYLDIPRKRYYEIVPEPVHQTRKFPVKPQPNDYRRSRRN